MRTGDDEDEWGDAGADGWGNSVPVSYPFGAYNIHLNLVKKYINFFRIWRMLSCPGRSPVLPFSTFKFKRETQHFSMVIVVVEFVVLSNGVAIAVVAVQVLAHLNVSPAILVYAAMERVGGRMGSKPKENIINELFNEQQIQLNECGCGCSWWAWDGTIVGSSFFGEIVVHDG